MIAKSAGVGCLGEGMKGGVGCTVRRLFRAPRAAELRQRAQTAAAGLVGPGKDRLKVITKSYRYV